MILCSSDRVIPSFHKMRNDRCLIWTWIIDQENSALIWVTSTIQNDWVHYAAVRWRTNYSCNQKWQKRRQTANWAVCAGRSIETLWIWGQIPLLGLLRLKWAQYVQVSSYHIQPAKCWWTGVIGLVVIPFVLSGTSIEPIFSSSFRVAAKFGVSRLA